MKIYIDGHAVEGTVAEVRELIGWPKPEPETLMTAVPRIKKRGRGRPKKRD
jgi:hypothetical protein